MKQITTSIAMGGDGDQTTTQEPPEFLKPYLSSAASEANRLFMTGPRMLPPDQSTIAPFNPAQLQAQDMLLNYATGGVGTPPMPTYQRPNFSNMDMSVAAPTDPFSGMAPTNGLPAEILNNRQATHGMYTPAGSSSSSNNAGSMQVFN